MDENRNQTVENQQPQQPVQPAQPQQPTQPQVNAAPQPQYRAPAAAVNIGKGGGWIGFVRVMMWIMFGIIELAVLITTIALIGSAMGYRGNPMMILAGLGVLVVGTLFNMMYIAIANILLDAAKNIERTATNTAEIARKLK